MVHDGTYITYMVFCWAYIVGTWYMVHGISGFCTWNLLLDIVLYTFRVFLSTPIFIFIVFIVGYMVIFCWIFSGTDFNILFYFWYMFFSGDFLFYIFLLCTSLYMNGLSIAASRSF